MSGEIWKALIKAGDMERFTQVNGRMIDWAADDATFDQLMKLAHQPVAQRRADAAAEKQTMSAFTQQAALARAANPAAEIVYPRGYFNPNYRVT
jgi:hypothetical protein